MKKRLQYPTYFWVLVLVGALVVGLQSFTGRSWTVLSQIRHTQVTIYPAFVLVCIAVMTFTVVSRPRRDED